MALYGLQELPFKRDRELVRFDASYAKNEMTFSQRDASSLRLFL